MYVAPYHGLYVCGTVSWSVCMWHRIIVCMYVAPYHSLYVCGTVSWPVCMLHRIIVCMYVAPYHSLYVCGAVSWSVCMWHGTMVDMINSYILAMCHIKTLHFFDFLPVAYFLFFASTPNFMKSLVVLFVALANWIDFLTSLTMVRFLYLPEKNKLKTRLVQCYEAWVSTLCALFSVYVYNTWSYIFSLYLV